MHAVDSISLILCCFLRRNPMHRIGKQTIMLKENFYKNRLTEGSVTCSNILNVQHSKGDRGSDHWTHGISRYPVGRH